MQKYYAKGVVLTTNREVAGKVHKKTRCMWPNSSTLQYIPSSLPRVAETNYSRSLNSSAGQRLLVHGFGCLPYLLKAVQNKKDSV